MKIKINETEIELKQSFRSLIAYEAIQGKPFTPNGFTELLTYFYSVILASKPDESISFDEFVEYVDANPDRLLEFSEWLSKNDIINKQFNKEQKKTPKKATKK